MKNKIKIPQGDQITIDSSLKFEIPNNPIIPFIEGDGIGADITPSMQKVVNQAVKMAYGNKKRIIWLEIYAGEKALKFYVFQDFLQ